eukprot:scaffold534822_cov39-Prasinocladus_malaysianus.AAC.1
MACQSTTVPLPLLHSDRGDAKTITLPCKIDRSSTLRSLSTNGPTDYARQQVYGTSQLVQSIFDHFACKAEGRHTM